MPKVKVKPYHSQHAERHGGVYHDRADCPDGSRIPSEYLAAGTAGLARCGRCAELEGRSPTAIDVKLSLTARETQVANLVARGFNNRAIAAELVISKHTADRHVSNILSKLGLNARSQIAAWAVGNGQASERT